MQRVSFADGSEPVDEWELFNGLPDSLDDCDECFTPEEEQEALNEMLKEIYEEGE